MSSIRRCTWLVVLVAAPALALPACGLSGDPEYQKRSRGQAELFLNSFKNNDGGAAYSLLTNDFQARLSDEERRGKTLKLSTWAAGTHPIASWQIKESKFEGDPHFKGVFNFEGGTAYPFEIKLAAPDWKVQFFTSETSDKK